MIGQQVGRLVKLCSDGKLSVKTLTNLLLHLENTQLRPHHLTLSASNTLDNWTNIYIKDDRTHRVCVAFEFLPAAGKFREVTPVR
jgi:hypothetical protein